MRRFKQEITDKPEIEDIISSAERLRVGINRSGAPYVVPMNFGYSDGVFYLHCAGEGLKLDLIKKDPRVCLEIDESSPLVKPDENLPCDWGVKYRSVIAVGNAEIIEELPLKHKALKIILEQFKESSSAGISDKAAEAVTVIRVNVEEITAKKSR